MQGCDVKLNTKKFLIEKGYIDENMVITNAMFFKENRDLSDHARNEYGVQNQGTLYSWQNLTEVKTKAIENEEFFRELQEKFDQKNQTIKPGVDELFESNPELANQVYEALGFKQKPNVILPIGTSGSGKSTFIKSLPQENLVVIEPDAMRVEFTGDINDKSKDKEIYIEAAKRAVAAIKQGKQVVFDTTNLTKDKRLPFIEAIKKEIPNANIQYKLMELNPELAKQRIKADIAAGKNRANVPDSTIDRHAESYKQMLEDIKSEPISSFDLTPQQEQQAKQLYSQYLDSIFPDSKVKDIVYRGKTDEQTNKKSKELGIFFTDDKNAANIYAVKYKGDEFDDSIIQGIVNKFGLNPTIEEIKSEIAFFEKMGASKEDIERNAKEFQGYIQSNKGISEQVILNIKNPKNLTVKDWFDNYDNANKLKENSDGLLLKGGKQSDNRIYDAGENQIVVFEPEQIHILGSKQDIDGFKNFISRSNSSRSENQYYQLSKSPDVEVTPEISTEKILLQQEVSQTTPSKANEKTLKLLKDFLKRAGIKVEALSEIVVNGKRLGVEGLADPIRKLIQYVEGKEETVLPEEAMHIAVEILEQKNPALFNKMLNKVTGYYIYDMVFAEYRNVYTTPDGKPDVRKIKKEAIGKLLAQMVVDEVQGKDPNSVFYVKTFWSQVVEFLKGLFRIPNFNPFEEAVKSVTEGTIDAEGVKFQGEVFFQLSPKQESIIKKLQQTNLEVTKKITKAESNDPTIDTAEDNFYERNGERVKRRVTDLVKEWYERKFGKATFSDKQNIVNEVARNYGTNAHKDIENLVKRYTDSEGKRLTTPKPRQETINTDPETYKTLESYVKDLLNTYDKDTVFLQEAIVYTSARGGEAGTIDFIAIQPDGTVDILDWKFMNNQGDDVPWYKQGAYNEQLLEYKKILSKEYGVTSFGKTRFVPFILNINVDKDYKNVFVKNIIAGSVDPNKISDLRLLPVATIDERTGDQTIDNYINKLFQTYNKISNERVKDRNKAAKSEQLNNIMLTIRKLQIQQDIKAIAEEAVTLSKKLERTLEVYNQKFKGKNFSDFTFEEIDDFNDELYNAREYAKTNSRIYTDFKNLIDTSTEEGKKILEELKDASLNTLDIENKIESVIKEYTQNFIADKVGIKDLLKPEKIVQLWTKEFRSLSKAGTKTTQILYKLVNQAFSTIEIKTDERNRKLSQLQEEYNAWAKSKGLTSANMYDILQHKKMVKGKQVIEHRLVDEIDIEAFRQFKTATQNKDKNWFNENIDIEAYKKEAEKEIERLKKIIDENIYYGEADEVQRKKAVLKDKIDKKYNLKYESAWGNILMKKFILQDKWKSEEYKELEKNEPAFKFYKYIRDLNDEALKAGYLEPQQARTFLPFMYKSAKEAIASGGSLSVGTQFIKGISTSYAEVNYGAIDPRTNKPILSIPKYYTEQLGETIYDEDGSKLYIDSSNVSKEMFQIISKFGEQVERYKEMSAIESSVKLLQAVEEYKEVIDANRWGKVKMTGTVPDKIKSDVNVKYLENFIKATVYDQQYTDEKSDVKIGEYSDKLAKKINGALKYKLLPEDVGDRDISVVKLIDSANRYFQLKTLGLNLGTSISTFFGGNFQAIINSGRFFTSGEFLSSELRVTTGNFQGEEGKKMFALLDYFLPMSELKGAKDVKSLGSSVLTQNSVSDFIMILQRNADKAVSYSIAQAYISNMGIIDGKLVNLRDYYKKSNEYTQRYSDPSKIKEIESSFESKVQELKDKYGLQNFVKFDDKGVAHIEGFERLSKDVIENREQMRLAIRSATGNVSKDDLNQIRMTVLGRSFMVFKNWIPKLIDTRFSEFSKNEGTGEYEWGRFRMHMKLLFRGNLNILPILDATPEGMKLLQELYEEKRAQYIEETGLDNWEITPEEFYDLVRQNLRSQLRDYGFGLALMGLILGAGYAYDDDDDSTKKNYYKLALKYIDKVADEVQFFYKPTSIDKILNGSLFPALGVLNDLAKPINSLFGDIFGDGDESDLEWAKNFLKLFPVGKETVNYIPFFSEDLAKEMNIRISKESRR